MTKFFTEVLAALFTGLLGFFCAGAIYLPIMHDYLGRVIFTLGAMALLYGSESVVRLGHVKACTIDFSVGNCTEYNLLAPSLVLWACFYALWRWRVWRTSPKDNTLGKPSGASNKPSIALAKPSYAAVAGISFALFACWTLLIPSVFSPTALGYPLRLLLTLGFGAMLYNVAKPHIVGTTQQLVVHLFISAVLGFWGAGLVYQLQMWAPPLDSPIDALFSLIALTITAGFTSVLYAAHTANALLAAFLLWVACFAWLRWRIEKQPKFAATLTDN
jgi:hypothetical protein